MAMKNVSQGSPRTGCATPWTVSDEKGHRKTCTHSDIRLVDTDTERAMFCADCDHVLLVFELLPYSET